MSQSYTKLLCHFVFATKDRQPLLLPDLESRLHPYMGGIIKRMGGIPLQIGGTADHVHVLAVTPAVISISDFMRDLKAGSSKWIHENWGRSGRFEWQRGYGAFSVAPGGKADVIRYIAGQKVHHKAESPRDEMLRLLREHEIEHDPQYV